MHPTRFVAAMVAAEVLGMLGISSFAGLLPQFSREWSLSATDAGWISGLYYAGYVAAVPILTAATDRIDPRRIYLTATALGGIANLAFALFADGFWSAVPCQILAGIGLAGTYMPGLKALTDRMGGAHQSRALASYTAGFSVGISLSFLLAGWIGPTYGWRWVFALSACGSVLALGIASLALTPSAAAAKKRPTTRLLDFRPVLTNRAAMGFVVGYGFHIWELFGLRSWIVAFLTFSVGLPRQGGTLWSPTWVASAVTLFGVVASIGGNELALRYGRRRVLSIIMTTSAMLACAVGFTATLDFPLVALFCLIYGGFVMADSASLTIGAVENATPGHRGATMAVHSSIGFIGAFLGPLCFGAVLDGAGGADHATAWGWAFASSGAAVACGALALALLNPQARTRTRS